MRILMIPAWYPSKQNPLAGCFFKEQAKFLSTKWDFSVLIYSEKLSLLGGKIDFKEVARERGLVEYQVVITVSYIAKVLNIIENIFLQRLNKIDGVGRYYSERYKRYQKRIVNKIIGRLPEEYDLVYGISAQGIAYQAQLFAELRKKPLVLSEHGPFPTPGCVVSNTLKEALEKADCFFAISNDKIRQVMLQNIKLRKIQYVGNLIDETIFRYEPQKHEVKTLLIVAAHSFYKNYDLFIETMDRLVTKTDIYFRVIIAGYDSNKEYGKNVEELEKKVALSKIADRTEMIKALDRSEMPALYNRADAFVMTSIQEGQPVSALEAGCCGLPIFSTRCGGVEDYVTEKMGRIVAIHDSEGLAECLRQFLEGEILFDARLIRENVVARFGLEAYANNVMQCFDTLLDKEDSRNSCG